MSDPSPRSNTLSEAYWFQRALTEAQPWVSSLREQGKHCILGAFRLHTFKGCSTCICLAVQPDWFPGRRIFREANPQELFLCCLHGCLAQRNQTQCFCESYLNLHNITFSSKAHVECSFFYYNFFLFSFVFWTLV